ncbi:MAG: glycosyltransferase family 4 protein, partial [Candidatus Limnocylindrus sp.]
MKIGIVTPYAYPMPGGVNDHVGSLYRVLRARGHDVRIITSSHGLQKASEGDIIRVGKGFSVPFNGSMGTVTLSPTYLAQMRAILERERFDVLHYHEPFVPFLSLVTLTLSTSVNVGTFHAFGGLSISYEFGKRMLGHYAGKLHGRIAVSPAARHFISRYFPGEYKIVPNGVEPGRYQRAVPIARYRDGVPNILFVGRMEPRKGLIHLLRAFRKLQRDGVRAR